ncbi:MAG: DUF11 domain-containing protein, partial [Williamsia herbipolensis]|nr:DUF11 domain-containing protein [Williamsia herbipolensis]
MVWRRTRRIPALLLVALLGLGLAVVAAPTPAHAATTLVSESFTGTSVADSRFVPLGPACLTAAPRPRQMPPAGSSALAGCQNTNQSPPATTPGWLQLTDSSFNQGGGVLFNQALPSSDGLVITFDQAQYGGGGADGIGFFLADGAYNLTRSGASGGALGYAQQSGTPGLVGGFLGVGLDAFGNFPGAIAGQGAGCTPPRSPGVGGTPNAQTRNSIAIRGPGAQDANGGWTSGYCLLQYQHLDPAVVNLRATPTAPVRVRVTVSPVAADGSVVAAVDLSTDAGATFTRYLQQTIADAPETVKFGFSGSTGGTTDVHLVRDVAVTTVNDIGPIGFVKQEDQSSASYRTIYQVGDTIPYQFVVTNPGSSAITDVAVTDPRVDGAVSCPSTTLAPAGRPGSSITCSGSHRVVAADLTSTTQPVSFVNTATVTGTASGIQQRETADQTVQLGALAMTGQKVADRTTGLSPGDRVNYTFRVTNTGSIPLARVTVTDTKLGINGAACTTNLAAGATDTCTTTGSHVVTEQDLLAGGYDNSASFTGTPGQGVTATPTTATSATRVTTVAPTTGLTLAKIADRTTGLALGSRVAYTFRATNTGNTTLTSLTVSD